MTKTNAEIWTPNDNLHRERAAETLEYLVTGTYVFGVYGFDIEEVDERIDAKTMIGFKLGFLGPWLPEWQFIETETGKADVSPLALDIWKTWGDFDQDYFIEVMATHTMDNVPDIGKELTYGAMVQQGLNPLANSNVRSLFRDHGISSM